MCNTCGLNLCTCKNWADGFHVAVLDHLVGNFQQRGWKLTYQTLVGPQGNSICFLLYGNSNAKWNYMQELYLTKVNEASISQNLSPIYLFSLLLKLQKANAVALGGTRTDPVPACVCRRCGNQLCVGTHIPDGGNRELFLTYVYRLFYEKWLRLHKPTPEGMTIPDLFTALFHEEDRPQVTQWLSQPEHTHALLIWGVDL